MERLCQPPSETAFILYREQSNTAPPNDAKLVVNASHRETHIFIGNTSHGETHFTKECVLQMADTNQVEQPRIKTEIKIGNTTYMVGGYFASSGVTVSEKIKKLLDKETKTISV